MFANGLTNILDKSCPDVPVFHPALNIYTTISKMTGMSTVVVLSSSQDTPVACVQAFCGQSGPDFH